jgi:hypothetical protein
MRRMLQKTGAAIARTFRGIKAAMKSRAGVVLGVTALVAVFNLTAPVVILSIARRPPDFFTFNPWLPRLPEYLRSDEALGKKLEFLSNMAIAWVTADDRGQEVDWGFLIDVPTLARIALTSLVFGAYFALWSYRRRQGIACGVGAKAARPAGVAGAVTSVLGLTTGPCSLTGCGAPVLPVVAIAFSGLSSGTLTLFSTISQLSILVVLTAMALAVLWLGWRVGGAPAGPPAIAGAA